VLLRKTRPLCPQYRRGRAQLESYGYDQLDRLTSSAISGLRNEVGYDPLGNITSRSDLGAYAYNTTNPGCPDPFVFCNAIKPHAVSLVANTKYTYDGAGRQIRKDDQGSSEVQHTSWTPFGKVLQMWANADAPGSNTGTVTFGYDADGQRVRKTTDTQSTTYMEDLYEQRRNADGSVQHAYFIGNGARVVAQLTVTADTATESQITYLHGDLVGSTEVMSAEDGTRRDKRSYSAFGAERNAYNWLSPLVITLSPDVHLGFTGHEQDSEYGLTNMKGRMYDEGSPY
jgi:YD repeat-containing protein